MGKKVKHFSWRPRGFWDWAILFVACFWFFISLVIAYYA